MFSLQAIVRSPPGRILSSEELDIVWKFRYYLTRDKKVNVLVYITVCILQLYFTLLLGSDKVPEMC